jgi:hypothetical protein
MPSGGGLVLRGLVADRHCHCRATRGTFEVACREAQLSNDQCPSTGDKSPLHSLTGCERYCLFTSVLTTQIGPRLGRNNLHVIERCDSSGHLNLKLLPYPGSILDLRCSASWFTGENDSSDKQLSDAQREYQPLGSRSRIVHYRKPFRLTVSG